MSTKVENHTKRNLVIFTLVVLGFAVLARFIEPFTLPPNAEPGAAGLGQLLWLATPLAIALLLRLFGGDGWGDFGLRPNFRGNGFWWSVSILVFPVVIIISMLLGALLGSLTINTANLANFADVLLLGLVWAMVKNVFEEFAWRGYLVPKMYALNINIWLAHTIIGLIWGAWHLPFVYAFWPYLTPNMMWYFVPLLLLGTISQSVVYGEIRLATDSVWPAWVMHTIGNAIGNGLILSAVVQLTSGQQEVWSSLGAEGVISIILMFTVGYWLHQRRENMRNKAVYQSGAGEIR